MGHQFRPLHDRVLLKRVEVEEKTPAGVIIYRLILKESEILGVIEGRAGVSAKAT